ncbi:MAG: type II toxin-antitoxin system Phd/YefM family antitoxin [Actinomycetaceae bacterium]|nr:type II toxin-antitoxin system Phd/YefM family antitoxin [Actinomycetaceae bacterium]
MAEMTISEARSRIFEVVDQARVNRETVFLTRRGKRVAAVVEATWLESLIADAEDLADIKAAAAARAEIAAGQSPIPWEEIKADLGL